VCVKRWRAVAYKNKTSLSPMLDPLPAGISIGSLDDEARDLAKARRKKLNAALEEELMPGGNAVGPEP